MEREIERFILNAHPKMSGRAVRLRAMLPSEVDAVSKEAGKQTSLALDYRLVQLRVGVARCLLGITRARVPMVQLPVPPGPDGKPKTKPSLDAEGNQKVDAEGKPETEPVTAPQPDAAWLSDEKNWIVPDSYGLELQGGYDNVIANAKDDAWLNAWWADTHEVTGDTIQRIMEKGQKVSSG